MDSHISKRVSTGPAVLFLGESYLKSKEGGNSFIELVASKIQTTANCFREIAHSGLIGDRSSFLAWAHQASRKLPISESLNTIFQFAWNHVYTTATDDVWQRALSTPWRSLYPIFSDTILPQDIRDRHRLCSTVLLGSVTNESEEATVPVDEFEWDARKQTAISLLQRLPDILTPRGVLLIEGWHASCDSLTWKDLFPILNKLGPEQVLLFGATSDDLTDPRATRLRDSRILQVTQEGLAEFLASAVGQGNIKLGDPGSLLSNGRQITINSKPQNLPKDLFLQVENVATILDDNLTSPPRPLKGVDARYHYLRFLEEPVKLRDWSGFARNFPFERDCLCALAASVQDALISPKQNEGPFVLYGDTGTGKTVALAHLAFRFSSDGTCPVVYIERSSQNIESQAWKSVDRLLNWFEDAGASSTLIVWDGMRRIDDYQQVWSRLADRGRKAVIVGSAYDLVLEGHTPRFVAAERTFNPNERKRFMDYLERWAPEVANWIRERKVAVDETFLVALYRLLPSSRPTLRQGVLDEVRVDQSAIVSRLRAIKPEQGLNSLEAALSFAGFLSSNSEQDSATGWMDATLVQGESLTAIQRLFALVMIAGRYGCRIPIELLLSSLKQPLTPAILEALRSNLFRWHEAPNGDVSLEPRQSLEAQIYLDSFFSGRAAPEAELICQMIESLPRQGHRVGSEIAMEFILDLLQLIGPNSQNAGYKHRFRNFEMQFAESLRRVRVERSVVSARLMLQEATFFREGVKNLPNDGPLRQKTDALDKAIGVLELALEIGSISPWQRSMISEELTACLGSLITTKIGHAQQSEIRQLYLSAKSSFRTARKAASTNVHAVVTLGWITREMFAGGQFSIDEKPEIFAELLALFDDADEFPLDSKRLEYYLRERASVMEEFGAIELSEAAFARLAATGSKAGYYLRARKRMGDVRVRPLTDESRSSISSALDYLKSNWGKVSSDFKCVSLYFDLWWLKSVGIRPFEDERQVLPFDDKEWEICLQLLELQTQLSEFELRPSVKFLYGMALFHLDQCASAERVFRELANDSTLNAGGLRLRKSFVASKASEPLVYDGQVQDDLNEHRVGRIWVPSIRSTVTIVPRDFDSKRFAKGETVTDFHIAFSFAGAIAQPAYFLRNRTVKN